MEKLRTFAQSINLSFESWLISFTGIVLVRILFEQYSSYDPGRFVLIDAPTIIHYGVFYLVTIVSLAVILMFFAKTSLEEVIKVCILGFLVIWIAPFIDLIAGGVGGHLMGYLIVPGKELMLRFVTFFGGHIESGITLGIQLETVLGIIFCYLYVHTVTKDTRRAIGAAVAFYCLIFFLVSTPSLIAWVLGGQAEPLTFLVNSTVSSHVIQNNVHPSFSGTNIGLFDLAFNKIMVGVNTILLIVAAKLLFYIGKRKKFMAVVKNSRPERIFHFLLLFIFGAVLTHTATPSNWVDVMNYVLAFSSFIFAWMYSVCQNDIYDEKIDAISNQDRPFISKELSKDDLQITSKIFLLLTYLSAYAAGSYTIFFVSLFLFVYYIYSNPPLRLKRLVMLNSFLVSLACLSVIAAGFFLASVDKSIVALPWKLVVAIIIFFTTVTNIRDLKDYAGDRADGIKTLPVLIGLENSKKLIAGIIAFFFVTIPWYFNLKILFIPGIIAGILSLYFITQKNYVEWKGFMVYMAYLIFIIGVLIVK